MSILDDKLFKTINFAFKNNFRAKAPISNISQLKKPELYNLLPYIPISKSDSFPVPDFQAIINEVKSLDDFYVPHRSYEGHRGWESICLYGISSVHIGAHEHLGYEEFDDRLGWTDASKLTPVLTSYLKSLPYIQHNRIRIMKLKSGGFIVPHTDVLNKKATGALNLAILNPDKCDFYIDKFGILPFDEYFAIHPNIGLEHCVFNRGLTDRYHIIIHGKQDIQFEKMRYEVLRSYVK